MTKPLTSRERIERAFHHEPVDRVPVTPFGLGRLREEDAIAQELIARTDPFLTAGLGGNIFSGKRFGERVETWTEGNDVVSRITTPQSSLTRRYRRTEKTGYTIEFPCKNAEDVLDYLSIPFEPAEPDATRFHQLKARYGSDAFILAGIPDAICFLADIMSPEHFALLWADAPDVACAVTMRVQERLIDYVERACRAGVDGFRIVGAEYVTMQLGPDAFQALCAQQDRELVETIHRYHGVAYYHVHGNMDHFLEAFLPLHLDALDPVEVFPYGDVTLADAKARVGDAICLVGGLDDMEVLETRDAATVRRMGLDCLQQAGSIGYCLGGTASGIFTEAGARNFIELVAVAEQFGSG